METKEAFRIALQSLWANKLRTVLTLLGVVISVASLIAVVTLINGAQVYVATKVNKQGANVFTVSQQPSIITSYDEYIKFQKRKVISLEQYRAMKEQCTLCKEVGAMQSTTGPVVYGKESATDVQIRGYTSYMPEMQNLDIVEGRSFTEADETHASPVCLIGADVEDNLLKGADPLGKEIRVSGVPYTVIGIGDRQGKTLGRSQDNWVAIPLTSYQKTYGTAKSVIIYNQGPNGAEQMEGAVDQARLIMRSARHDRPGAEDSFTIETSNALAGLLGTITGYFGAVAVAIAAISLVVGGIVIMNIMLVSVTERVREIGLRKALGATHRAIRRQFLVEASVLGLAGGILGAGIGLVGAVVLPHLISNPITISPTATVGAIIVAVGIGIVFGVYPATRAARLAPIDALRGE